MSGNSEAQFVTLDEVINDLLIDEGKSSQHEYIRYYNIGLRGLKEMSFDVVRNVKSIELSLNKTTNSVVLPTDYVKYTAIAVVGGNNELQYLGHKERLNMVSGAKAPDGGDDTSAPVFNYSNVDDGIYGRYGVGGGNNSNGYYRVNLDEGTIEFSSVVSTLSKVVLEYISDGSTGLSGDEIKIHAFAEEALRSFVYWKSIQRKRGINANEKMAAKREFYNQKRLARARMNSFTKEEALQTTRKAFKQSPKF